jgi:hypothetical protein
MRRWDEAGRVRLTTWEVTRDWLPAASAVVLSIEDLQGDLQAAQAMAEHCRVLVVTEGPRGARVHAQLGVQERQRQAVRQVGPGLVILWAGSTPGVKSDSADVLHRLGPRPTSS